MGVVKGITWGVNGVTEGNSKNTISDKTNTSFTAKHTSSNALAYRGIRFDTSVLLPKGASLTKITANFTFSASGSSSHRAAIWKEGGDSTEYVTSKGSLGTSETAVTLTVNASSITKVSDTVYGFGLGGYKSTLGSFNWYFSNVSFDLEYTIPTYAVSTSASPAAGGTVTGGGTYESGKTATVTAIPNAGYEFSYWLVDGNNFGNVNPIVAEIYANYTVVAVFEKLKTNNIYKGTQRPKEIYIGDIRVKEVYMGKTLVYEY